MHFSYVSIWISIFIVYVYKISLLLAWRVLTATAKCERFRDCDILNVVVIDRAGQEKDG